MSAAARALAHKQLLEDDAAWRLLRADNAPIVAALLAEHLAGENLRLDADELYERIDTDLDELRARGEHLPRTARAYVADWRNAGFLVRRATEQTRAETFELSSSGLVALRFLDSRAAPRKALTESRLASLSGQLRQLAIDTDPQSTRRLQRLTEERDAINDRIAAIQAGGDSAVAGERALERVHDLLAQASEVPDDFARVRAEFEKLNQLLRARILESGQSQREVLDDVFRGVDLISESDAGRSFSGFSALVLDPAIGAAFEDDIGQLLERDFSRDLTPAQRRALREFLTTLKDRSAEIHTVITQFARGLRRYVRSQDYQRDRVLRGMIADTLVASRAAAEHVKPWQPIGHDVDLTSVPLASIGALSLHDPADMDAAGEVKRHAPATASIEELRTLARATEIDFDELARNVNDVVGDDGATASVGDVIAAHPATQGVASVVGLLALAAAHGSVDPEQSERLSWQGSDDVARSATVALHIFTGRIP